MYIKKILIFFYSAFYLAAFLTPNSAVAASAYLPIKQSASIERKVDKLLLLANMTTLKKPIAINQVNKAVEKVCSVQNSVLCSDIRNHLKKYKTTANLIDAKVTIQLSNRDDAALANQRGIEYQSNYHGHATGFSRINDYISFSAGIQMDEDNLTMENTYLSVGTDWLQFDLGTKPHWLSPMENSAMLLSTHASTIPTLSISNSTPLTSFQINYEVFVGELSTSDKIYYQEELISGKPIITGLHFSITPWSGFSLGINRLLQSGGGDRGSNSLNDFFGAFFKPTTNDNTSKELSADEEFGNQTASLASQFTFSGPTPFSIYFEYAGEDTSRGFNYKLGNIALSAGLYIPTITDNIGLRLEISEWQNAWYVHHVYRDGLTNRGNIIGHWAAESRYRENSFAGDGVGAYNIMAKLYWQPKNGDNITFLANVTENEDYTQYDYHTSYQVKATWSKNMHNHIIESSIEYGKDIFNESYYSVSASLSW